MIRPVQPGLQYFSSPSFVPMDPREWSLRSRTILFVLLLLVGSMGAMAQPTVSVRGNVGATFFRSPDGRGQTLNSGVAFGLEAGLRFYRGLAVTVQGGYDQFTLNEETTRLLSRNDVIQAGDLSFLNGSLGLRYTYVNDGDAHPFISAGVGLYRVRSGNWKVFEEGEVANQGAVLTQRDEGIHLGVGSVFRLDDTYAVFFEPRYIFYDLSEDVIGSIRYFTLRLGVDVQL